MRVPFVIGVDHIGEGKLPLVFVVVAKEILKPRKAAGRDSNIRIANPLKPAGTRRNITSVFEKIH
jgi:hypothetical protein